MSKVEYIDGCDAPCTEKCHSFQHGDIITSAITKRDISDQDLCCYLSYVCVNYQKVRDSLGRTALHMASACGRLELVRWLIDQNSDINSKSMESGYTPLHLSVFHGKINVSVELMKSGANMNVVDYDRMTPLDHAMQDSERSLESVGDMYVWGSNSNSTLGPNAARLHPELFDAFHRQNSGLSVRKISLNKFHTLILTSNKEVYVCGHGQGGRLGLDNSDSCVIPKQLAIFKSLLDGCKDISAGKDHSMFLTSCGKVYVCGLNTYFVLGIVPPPKELFRPQIIHHLPDDIKGISASTYHSLAWTDKNLYVWGLNLGQISTKDYEKHLIKPRIFNYKETAIITAIAGENATAYCCSNGEIYVMHNYICKKIQFELHLKLDVEEIKIATTGKNNDVMLALRTSDYNVFMWKNTWTKGYRAVYSSGRSMFVTSIALNLNEILLTTLDGYAYKGVIEFGKIENIPDNPTPIDKLVNMIRSVFIRLTRISRITRAIAIHCDPYGKDYVILQSNPQHTYDNHFEFVMGEYDGLHELYCDTDSDDTLHDVIFLVKNQYFLAHRSIVASRSQFLAEIIANNQQKVIELDDYDPCIFKQFLEFIYTKEQSKIKNGIGRNNHNCKKDILLMEAEKLLYPVKFEWNNILDYADVTINCEDNGIVMAHKCILISQLEYFRNIFATRWSENETGTTTISLPFDSGVVKTFIQLLYNNFEENSDENNVDHFLKVLILSDQLCANAVKVLCERKIAKLLSFKNLGKIYSWASMYNSLNLIKICMHYIIENLATVLELQVLNDLDDGFLQELSDYYYNKCQNFLNKRIITPYQSAPPTEDVLRISANLSTPFYKFSKRKSQKTHRRRTKEMHNYISNDEAETLEPRDVPEISLIDSMKSCHLNENGSRRINAILEAQRIIQEEKSDIKFSNLREKLDENIFSFDEFPLLSDSPSLSGCTSKSIKTSRPNVIKISQKQRKRLNSENSTEVSSSGSPKNPWKLLNQITNAPSTGNIDNLQNVIMREKKQKENLQRIRSKSLKMTEIEDRAILCLKKFYNIENVFDEIITVERVDVKIVAAPVWIPRSRKF